jgi:hypothetical protein
MILPYEGNGFSDSRFVLHVASPSLIIRIEDLQGAGQGAMDPLLRS